MSTTQTVNLTANVVSTVTFNTWYASIEVVNTNTTAVWIRTDLTNPSIGGTNSIIVPGQSWINTSNDALGSNNTQVRILSPVSQTVTVSVQ